MDAGPSEKLRSSSRPLCWLPTTLSLAQVAHCLTTRSATSSEIAAARRAFCEACEGRGVELVEVARGTAIRCAATSSPG